MAGMSIAENLKQVLNVIEKATLQAGRPEKSVRLIAVSKTKPLNLIGEAVSAGQMAFGENYVQEAVEKVEKLPTLEWHMIGSLQSNKAKQVIGPFQLIHSVDRPKLAVELNRAASAVNHVQDILMQVQIGDEATKHGVNLEQGAEFIEQILKLRNLRLCGVMALPPLSDDEVVSRRNFAQLSAAFQNWQRQLGHSENQFRELSMGTSSDYQWAILEGATMVRVGTAIFGHRN
jgi:pyridoxal phosphate enzyme (YggS family)